MKLLKFFFLLGALSFIVACGSRHSVPQTEAEVDSLIRRHLDSLYSEPVRTDVALADVQRTLTDSALWLRVDLFRAVVCMIQGDSAACRQKQLRVMDWCRRNPGHDNLAGMAWSHCGVSHYFAGRADSSRLCYEHACRLLEQSSDRRELVSACINLADADLQSGRIADAAAAYRRAHFVADSIGMDKDLVAINSGLASVYLQLENFKEAHRYLDEARKGIDGESEYDRYYFYMTSGNCYFFENRYADALEAFGKALPLARHMDNAMMLAQCEGNIGEVYLRLGKPAEARPYILGGERFSRNHPEASPALLFYLRSLIIDLALAENRLADAGRLLALPVDSARIAVPRYVALHYDRLRNYAERRGDWAEAYRYQLKARALYDSLRNRTVVNNVAEMTARYARDTTLLHQHAVISDYKAKVNRQRSYTLLAVAGVVIIALGVTVAIFIARRRAERRYRRQVEQIARLRMDVVRNRLSPHFIFNVLGTILPKFRAYPELERPLDLLVDVLRDNLPVTGELLISLAEEKEKVERYVELFHCTHGAFPRVEWQIDDNVPADTFLPAMILQIPVENALKHAFPRPDRDSLVCIRIESADDGIYIHIVDNGCGLQRDRISAGSNSTGIGLRVLSRTIELFNTANARNASFSLNSIPAPQHGTEAHIYVPFGYGIGKLGGNFMIMRKTSFRMGMTFYRMGVYSCTSDSSMYHRDIFLMKYVVPLHT